jgi:hypothetical protein
MKVRFANHASLEVAMNWLLKVLGALARPLGISSPEDLRSGPGSRKESKSQPQIVHRLAPDKRTPTNPNAPK